MTLTTDQLDLAKSCVLAAKIYWTAKKHKCIQDGESGIAAMCEASASECGDFYKELKAAKLARNHEARVRRFADAFSFDDREVE